MKLRIHGLVAFAGFQIRRALCWAFDHRPYRERTETHELLYCLRCRRLFSSAPLRFTYRRDVTYGDVERRMIAHPPPGYSFVSCNWKKRKAKFVSPSGMLKHVSF